MKMFKRIKKKKDNNHTMRLKYRKERRLFRRYWERAKSSPRKSCDDFALTHLCECD